MSLSVIVIVRLDCGTYSSLRLVARSSVTTRDVEHAFLLEESTQEFDETALKNCRLINYSLI